MCTNDKMSLCFSFPSKRERLLVTYIRMNLMLQKLTDLLLKKRKSDILLTDVINAFIPAYTNLYA